MNLFRLLLAGSLLFATPAIKGQDKPFHQVAYDDCGEADRQPHLILGENYVMPERYGSDMVMRTCNFGGRVIYAFDHLDIQANYRLEIAFLADHARRLTLTADGNALCDPIDVPSGQVVRKVIDLPRHAFAYGQFVLVIEKEQGDNALVSEIRMLSTNKKPLDAVPAEARTALQRVQSYHVNTDVNADSVLPLYVPVPAAVHGVYRPVQSLNGTWQFSEQAQGDRWHAIQVPGEWAMQGFRVDSAGTARYRRTFDVPADWAGQRVFLRFDAVHSQCAIYVNGRRAGAHSGGMTPYDLDVTALLRPGTNSVALDVQSETEADMLGSMTQYATHQLGGITRKVTLFAVPGVYLSDLRVETDLDSAYHNARLRLTVAVTNATDTIARGIGLRATLDRHTASGTLSMPDIAPGQTQRATMEVDVQNPLLWDNEHPNLYQLCLDLNANTTTLAQVRRRIGFREVEVRGNEVLVNGRPVKLKGVCRHEAHPLYGRSLTPEEWKADAALYREANCNFIRTSHYPPAEEFIEWCDAMGLFVELEAPVCWVGHSANENWQRLNYKDDHYYDYILQANMEAIHFYRNHPSVLFWSLANESYWSKGFAQVAEYVRKADPTRPFSFHDQAYGGYNNQGSTTPIANIHYPGPSGYRMAEKIGRPMTYGEYCHLNVYNRTELETDPGVRSDWALALQPMWERMYATPGILGGSIWSGIDDIFQLPDGRAVGYGSWGPVDGWRRTKPEYWDMKKVFTPIKVTTTRLEPAATLHVALENRYTFTNLNETLVRWHFAGAQGTVTADVAPGSTGTLAIVTGCPAQAGQLRLEVMDPRGFVADEYLIPVGPQAADSLSLPPAQPTRLKSGRSVLTASGRTFRCTIDRTTGALISAERDGHPVLTGGPWLMALPLTGGGCYPNHNADTPVFNDLCDGWKATSVTAETVGNDVIVHVKGTYRQFDGGYDLTINANGTLRIDYRFTALEDINPRQWGMVFETSKGYDETFWQRNGLWSVYPDDHIGRTTGTALSFYPEVPARPDARTAPTWAWSKDHNALGSNDFRSTRRNILRAGLRQPGAVGGVMVCSDGKQHWRAWKAGERSRFLVADFVTAGAEMFLGSHYAPFRKPLKSGDTISGTITLQL